MQVGELFIALGFDVDDSKLKSFNDGIKSSMTDLLKLSGIAAGAVYSIDKFIESSLHNSTSLRQFTAETGESAEALKKWQVAAQLSNPEMSIDEVTAAFKRMNAAISSAQYSGEKGGVFAQLGINNVQNKTSAQLLDELRHNFQSNVGRWGLPKTLDFMEQLGVPKSMARTFKLSDEDIDKMTRGLTVTDQQNEKMNKLADTIRRASLEWQHWKDVITAQYSDDMILFVEKASKKFNDLYLNVKSFIDRAPEFSDGLKIMAGGAAFLMAAFAPLTTLMAGILLLFNDIGSYSRGAPSYIGDIIDFAKGAKKGFSSDNYKGSSLDDFIKNGGTYREIGPSGNGVTMNNSYHIQSTADPNAIANEVVQTQQQQLNRAYSGLNRGGF